MDEAEPVPALRRADGNKAGLETRLWRTGVAYALRRHGRRLHDSVAETLCRYHLGSMAMGGLMTMLFRFLAECSEIRREEGRRVLLGRPRFMES